MADARADHIERLCAAATQDQFLEVISAEEATNRLEKALSRIELRRETVPLSDALGRTLSEDVRTSVDVPCFDRSLVDGFAVRSADLASAREGAPVRLKLTKDILSSAVKPSVPVETGLASVVATGGMIPRGADAVVLVERTALGDTPEGLFVEIWSPANPGQFIATAGSDIGMGETVLRAGTTISARETAILAAIGHSQIAVFARPQVAILSTGDELVPPGDPLSPGQVYDSNAAVLTAAVQEAGGLPVPLGIVPDQPDAIREALLSALIHDIVLLSGGTSKGAGDLTHKIVIDLADGAPLVHGVAVKPGKPFCVAMAQSTPIAILPGFPTSAMFTFHAFVSPMIRQMAGKRANPIKSIDATIPVAHRSEQGRREFVMASLVEGPDGPSAYPLNRGSGSVTTFAAADGFFAIPEQQDILAAASPVRIQLLSDNLRPADLSIIGSHCVGLDLIVSALVEKGLLIKVLSVGSMGGLAALERGEADIAPIHLLDPQTKAYNLPFLAASSALIKGYGRAQGIVRRKGANISINDPNTIMVNRNAGSGTRVLIDNLLAGQRPEGFWNQPKSHNAVAASVAQGRADWGVTLSTVASAYGLDFEPLQTEEYDFAVRKDALDSSPLKTFIQTIQSESTSAGLRAMGFQLSDPV